jgi:hypothetical protein
LLPLMYEWVETRRERQAIRNADGDPLQSSANEKTI